MGKMKAAIIGTGNIGSDLLVKLMKSPILECGVFTGHKADSRGIARAKALGVPTSIESVSYIEKHPDCCDLVFDATSVEGHRHNAPILKRLGKFTIDLTPAHIGTFCIPAVNLAEGLEQDNVNLITCGGQAIIPIALAISKVQPDISYLELVATIASKSAGMGTRNNIDEFTQTTKDALRDFTGVAHTKAMINLNPAEPPITMHNTLYILCKNPDMPKICQAAHEMEQVIQGYVPGFHIVLGPVLENGRVTLSVEVTGSGDYLPKYAGNLDIITCAAVKIATEYALKKGYGDGGVHEGH